MAANQYVMSYLSIYPRKNKMLKTWEEEPDLQSNVYSAAQTTFPFLTWATRVLTRLFKLTLSIVCPTKELADTRTSAEKSGIEWCPEPQTAGVNDDHKSLKSATRLFTVTYNGS